MVERRSAHHSYDTEFVTTAERSVRQRVGVTTDQGRVTQFTVRLEYRTDPTGDGWGTVVQYDHASRERDTTTNDVTKAGLHIDIHGGGEPIANYKLTPRMPANAALTAACTHLSEHVETYVERHERWHGIDQNRIPTEEVEILREELQTQRVDLHDYLAGEGVNVSGWRFARDQD